MVGSLILINCLPAEMQEGRVALLAELLVVLRVDSTHGLHHLLAELHGWGQRLGVTTQDVAEVDVEELAGGGQQQVVQVAVSHPQQVRDHTVASWNMQGIKINSPRVCIFYDVKKKT